MKYTIVIVLAASTLIGLLIFASRNKQDVGVAPKVTSVTNTNSTITVEGKAEISLPERK